MIDDVLKQRNTTHGDFAVHARITQALKSVCHDTPNWGSITDEQRETIEMIAHKLGRILAGNPNVKDHWTDIIGYTRLVERTLAEPSAAITPPAPSPVPATLLSDMARDMQITEGDHN